MSDFPSAPPPSGMTGTGGVPATPVQRLIARIIDGLIAFAMYIPGYILLFIGTAIGGGFGALVAVLGILLLLVGLGAALYMIIGGIGKTGQTPGKRMQGIKVVGSASGQPIGIGGTVVRLVVEWLTAIPCYLGYLWIFFDSDKKTLYDKILDNEVVSAEQGGLLPIFPDGNPI